MVNIRHVFNFSSLFYGLIEYSYRYFSRLLIVLSAFHFWPCNKILLRKNENSAKSARSLYLFSCQGALSICGEKPVVPVGNQMEWAFPLEIFRKNRNTFRGIPLFPFLPEIMTGKFLFHLQQPVCSLKEQGRQVTQRTLIGKCTRCIDSN